jgi:hypothetical protein
MTAKPSKKARPTLVSRYQFAEDCGVTKAAIVKAIRSGTVTLTGDRIDPAHPSNIYYRQNCNPRQRCAGPATVNPDVSPSGGREAQRKGPPKNDFFSGGGDLPLKAKADILKIKAQITALQLKNQQTRNELISFDLDHRVFSMWHSIESTELLSLGDRIAPEVLDAARVTVDDRMATITIGQMITSEVIRSLEHIQKLIENFIKSIPVEDGEEKD